MKEQAEMIAIFFSSTLLRHKDEASPHRLMHLQLFTHLCNSETKKFDWTNRDAIIKAYYDHMFGKKF
jgi:hypothetical protein